MATTMVAAADYTADDLLSTVRVTGPWWFCLTEHLADPMGDAVLSSLIAAQQRVLHDLAYASDLPSQLFNLDLTGEHELSLGISLLRNRMDPDHRAALEHCVDQSMALITDGARRVRSLRPPTGPAAGTVAGLFVSPGGVPKTAVSTAEVGLRGAVGDKQRTRRHHGRAWQALCLWSEEVVDRLQAVGHPISPGNAGENVSVRGLSWDDVRPGALLTIGTMVCEVSLYALPCSKNAQWFTDGDFERMHHRRETGVSRVYASVVRPGTVSVGDVVSLS